MKNKYKLNNFLNDNLIFIFINLIIIYNNKKVLINFINF